MILGIFSKILGHRKLLIAWSRIGKTMLADPWPSAPASSGGARIIVLWRFGSRRKAS